MARTEVTAINWNFASIGLFATVVACAWPANAQEAAPAVEPIAPFVTTHHETQIRGQMVGYRAVVGETVMDNESGEPAATIFSTSYLKDGAGDARPVTFVFNGGPGASSSPLHLGVGPVLTVQSRDAGVTYDYFKPDALTANPDTVLDSTDLVFIDPVGTGYSRVLEGSDGGDYWGVEEDARSVLEFIRKWRVTHKRTNSPLFLMGESYGGARAATMLDLAGDLNFNGVTIISGIGASISGPGNVLPHIFMFPNYAVTAAYHNIVAQRGRSLQQIFDEAAEFARKRLGPALFLGRRLDSKEKSRLAKEMSEMIGVSPEFILANDLHVDRRKFQTELLKDRGHKIGRLDSRYTGPVADYEGKTPPYDDPYMTAGGPSTRPLLEEYFTQVLGFKTSRLYNSLNLEVNSKWNWEQPRAPSGRRSSPPSSIEKISKAMRKNPEMHLLVVAGFYDGGGALSSRYAIDHSDIDPDRVTHRAYNSGHTVFVHKPVREEFTRDVRALVDAATIGK